MAAKTVMSSVVPWDYMSAALLVGNLDVLKAGWMELK